MERNEALEVVRKNYPHVSSSGSEFETALRTLVPDLAESKEEAVRKELIAFHKDAIQSLELKETESNAYEIAKHKEFLDYLEKQKEQKPKMIQWTGNNLKEVIDFTGKSPRFGEWFKSWDDFENYVHSHGNILKLFAEDGSHFEIPVGSWIVKTPDGFNVPSVFRFVQKPAEWSEEDWRLLDEMREHLMHVIGDRPDISPNKIYEGFIDLIDRLKSLRRRQVGKVQFAIKAEVWTPTEAELRDLNLIVKQNKGNALGWNLKTLYDELCRLHPQPQWKPSDEQMKALCSKLPVVKGGGDKIQDILETLYDDLKKLM